MTSDLIVGSEPGVVEEGVSRQTNGLAGIGQLAHPLAGATLGDACPVCVIVDSMWFRAGLR